MLRQFDENSFVKINPREESQRLMISQKSRTETIVYDNMFEGPVSYVKTLHFMIANEFLRRDVEDVVIYEHVNNEHLWDADLAAFLATAQFKNRSLKRRKLRHVEVKLEPIRDADGLAYEVLHPDCNHEGKHRGVFFNFVETGEPPRGRIQCVKRGQGPAAGVWNTLIFPVDKHHSGGKLGDSLGVFVRMPGFLRTHSVEEMQDKAWKKDVIQWVIDMCLSNVYSNCASNPEIHPKCIIIEDAQSLLHALGSEQNILDCVQNFESLISDGDHPIETQVLFNNIIVGRKLS